MYKVCICLYSGYDPSCVTPFSLFVLNFLFLHPSKNRTKFCRKLARRVERWRPFIVLCVAPLSSLFMVGTSFILVRQGKRFIHGPDCLANWSHLVLPTFLTNPKTSRCVPDRTLFAPALSSFGFSWLTHLDISWLVLGICA